MGYEASPKIVGREVLDSGGACSLCQYVGYPFAAGIAFVSVRNGNIPLQRQWMARSYAITTVFLTNRIFAAIPAIDRAQNRPGGMVVHVGMEWSILVATLVLTELGLAWSGIFTNKRVAS